MIMTRCFILVGVESSGNHLFQSLFARLLIDGKPLLGTDMCGWFVREDRKYPLTHRWELFHPVWQGAQTIEEIAHGAPFVTGRSYPCSKVWPDARKFYFDAQAAGYTPLIVILTRDSSIAARSAHDRHQDPHDVKYKWNRMLELAAGPDIAYKYISYEALLLGGKHYFDAWLAEIDPALSIAPSCFNHIFDANVKHVQPIIPYEQLEKESPPASPKPPSHVRKN